MNKVDRRIAEKERIQKFGDLTDDSDSLVRMVNDEASVGDLLHRDRVAKLTVDNG